MATPKIALVTGANRGIGLETVKQLAELGITVLLGARDLSKSQAAVEKLRADHGLTAIHPIKLDVSNRADHTAVRDHIDRQFGHLDILVNNAGIALGSFFKNTSLETTDQELQETFDTNFFAVVALTNSLLPLLRKSPAGRIVNLSSILGSQTLHATPGSPIYDSKLLSYDASKAALNSYTIHLAHALQGTKIKVNSAHPGWVKTDMGTDAAPLEIPVGAKTSVQLATLPDDGPTGGFFHLGEALPW